jgi:hypothetical protein
LLFSLRFTPRVDSPVCWLGSETRQYTYRDPRFRHGTVKDWDMSALKERHEHRVSAATHFETAQPKVVQLSFFCLW